MRGEDIQQHDLFSYGSLEQRVPADHPLRPIRAMVDEALKSVDGRFEEIYEEDGRKWIPPERLLRALLLQMLYTVRSERMLMEQLEYNLLFRWFVGLSANEPVWHPTVFTKNRDRLLEGVVAEEFFSLVVDQARQKRLLSDDHFTVDGTLIEAWAGQKSFQTKKGTKTLKLPPPQDPGSNPAVNFRKQKRRNETHQSLTDPFARLFKKSSGRRSAALLYGTTGDGEPQWFGSGHTPDSVDRGSGAGCGHRDDGAEARRKRLTLGGDRGYDTQALVEHLRGLHVTPHVAQHTTNRRSAIDARTTRHEGYAVSQRKRKRVEEVFGWMKTIALQRKTRFRGPDRVGWMFTFAAAAYNLVRMRNLLARPA